MGLVDVILLSRQGLATNNLRVRSGL